MTSDDQHYRAKKCADGKRYADAYYAKREPRAVIAGVYFIQEGYDGPVKIGHSADVHKRRTELQTGNPQRLYVRAVRGDADNRVQLEAEYHQKYANFQIYGEWYAPHPLDELEDA